MAFPEVRPEAWKNPVKAIRAWCIDCMGGSAYEVKKCEIERCPLYPFREGHNPFRKQMSEERREAQRQHMYAMNFKRDSAKNL